MPPQETINEDELFKLAFQHTDVGFRVLSEYTRNDESVENWSKLVMVQYFPDKSLTPLIHLQVMTKALQFDTPVPHTLLYM